MWMQALLLTPYLVLASSILLAAVVGAICWTQSFPQRPDYAIPPQRDRRPIPRREPRALHPSMRALRIHVLG